MVCPIGEHSAPLQLSNIASVSRRIDPGLVLSQATVVHLLPVEAIQHAFTSASGAAGICGVLDR